MKFIRWKRKWDIRTCILLLGVGFIAGILYEKFTYKTYEDSVLLFEPYYLENFLSNRQTYTYFWSILRARILPVVIFLAIGRSRFSSWFVGVLLTGSGCLLGILVTLAMIKQGFKGLLRYTAMILPHGLFYGLAYCIVCSASCIGSEGRWNAQKILVSFTSFTIGILIEFYVMPFMLRLFV